MQHSVYKRDLSYVTFSGFRYIRIVYNNPSVANSALLMFRFCQFNNIYVNKS
jgi:hypothetical protein